jgi:FMN phosphatase YigB (HAD superfamily)
MIVKVILFDIGGVLTHDGHETYLTDPIHGLCSKKGLSKNSVLKTTGPIFTKFANGTESNEASFWREISKALGLRFSETSIIKAKKHLDILEPAVHKLLQDLQTKNLRIGLISNCTPFFYKHVKSALNLEALTEPTLRFLSFERGVLKSEGLFALAAKEIGASTKNYVIDDREHNIERAEDAGFIAYKYSPTKGPSLQQIINRILVD